MVLALTSVSPSDVEDNGGEVLEITGTFGAGALEVCVVADGKEYPCYSGVSGKGYSPEADSATLLKVVSPPLPRGGPYTIRVRQGAEEVDLVDVITVVNRNFLSRVFAFRQLLPPGLRVGPRTIDLASPLADEAPPTLSYADEDVRVGDNDPSSPTTTGTITHFSFTGTAPPGRTMDADTGVWSGEYEAEGVYEVTVTAHGPGGEDTDVVTFTVGPPAFAGGNLSAASLLEAAQLMATADDTAAPGATAGGTLTINGVGLGDYSFHKVTGPVTISSFLASEWFTDVEDSESSWIVVDGDLIIEAGVVFTPAVRKRFAAMYVTGRLTNRGEISMSRRGASHVGSPAGDILIAVGTFDGVVNPKVPAVGGAGHPESSSSLAGVDGVDGGTGGGGHADASGTSGPSGAGTAFSGGSGSAGTSGSFGQGGATANGGPGGQGHVTTGDRAGGGGAGNPGGLGASVGTGVAEDGQDGTGGTIIIFAGSSDGDGGSGVVSSDGADGGDVSGASLIFGGAGSGAGSVTGIVGEIISPMTTRAQGGAGGTTTSGSGHGGRGGHGTARWLTGL